MENGKTLRILERKTMPLKPPKDIREQAVAINQKLERYGPLHSRLLAEILRKPDYITKLLERYPIIHEQPILMNVLTDFSLIRAMLLEEHGFIHQHPTFVEIVTNLVNENNFSEMPELGDLLRRYQRRPPRNGQQQQQPVENRPRQQVSFTSQMLQQALAQSLAGFQQQPAAAGSSTGQEQDVPASQEPMEVDTSRATPEPVDNFQQYAQQNAQLHDLGFMDDNENITALVACEGDVQNAIELIITMRIACEGDVQNAIELIITMRSQMDDMD
uniref:UBA domain-containing protein n=2 Tax=Panagrolaimus sp. JU765 TaxID=591449 RepID=A0AC34QJ20_9BILA